MMYLSENFVSHFHQERLEEHHALLILYLGVMQA